MAYRRERVLTPPRSLTTGRHNGPEAVEHASAYKPTHTHKFFPERRGPTYE